jgi:hypothetical protein
MRPYELVFRQPEIDAIIEDAMHEGTRPQHCGRRIIKLQS